MADWLKGFTEYYNAKELPFTLKQAGLAIYMIVTRLKDGEKIKINDFKSYLDVCFKGLEELPSIIEEIKRNIDTLQGKERERYIFKLLIPFVSCKELFSFYKKHPALFLYRKGERNLCYVKCFIDEYSLE